jgi:hypothetical protein
MLSKGGGQKGKKGTNMEISVKCGCGSHYSFEDEPVNDQLRFPIACPHCGTDGTSLANEYIRKFISGDLERERQQASVWWRRLFKLGREQVDHQEHEHSGPTKIRFGLGAITACAGAFAGILIWYSIINWMGFGFMFVGKIVGSVMALAVGWMIGFGAKRAAGSGSFGLAGVTGLCAFITILGGQFLVLHKQVQQALVLRIAASYNEMTDYAKQAEKAKTDEDVQSLLEERGFNPHDIAPGESVVLCKKRQESKLGFIFGRVTTPGSLPAMKDLYHKKSKQEEITDADIALFRKRELPELKAFLNGKPSRAEFSQALGDTVRQNLSTNKMIAQSWAPHMFLWLVICVATAYKVAYDQWETETV